MKVRTLCTLLMLALAAPVARAPAQLGSLPGQLIAASDQIFVRFVFSEASLTSTLGLYSAADPSALLQTLFTNRVAQGFEVMLNPAFFTVGQELIFGLATEQGNVFFMGPGSRNPDGARHFVVGPHDDPRFNIRVGVEDLIVPNNEPNQTLDPRFYNLNPAFYPDYVQGDFNDMIFDVSGTTVIPEPASMILLGSGLAGLAAFRRRRQQKLEELEG